MGVKMSGHSTAGGSVKMSGHPGEGRGAKKIYMYPQQIVERKHY